MSKNITVSEDLYKKAAEVAAKDHVSVDEFAAAAIANRLASREFIESRAKLFKRAEFEGALAAIPDVEPADFDRP